MRMQAGPSAHATFAWLACLLTVTLASPLSAQTFQGRVLDEQDQSAIPTALVRLVDRDGEQHAVSIADSSGVYHLVAPEPGVYRLEAARLGFENFETPLLEAGRAEGVYPLDLLLRRAPVEIPGLTVETRVSAERADRQVRLMLGISPRSLRYDPIRFDEIQDHIASGRNLEGVMRWSQTPGLIVSLTLDGPCFSVRARGCLGVYLNGLPLNRNFVEDLPLDMLHTIVVVTPNDGSLTYPSGAVLLFTEAWLR